MKRIEIKQEEPVTQTILVGGDVPDGPGFRRLLLNVHFERLRLETLRLQKEAREEVER